MLVPTKLTKNKNMEMEYLQNLGGGGIKKWLHI